MIGFQKLNVALSLYRDPCAINIDEEVSTIAASTISGLGSEQHTARLATIEEIPADRITLLWIKVNWFYSYASVQPAQVSARDGQWKRDSGTSRQDRLAPESTDWVSLRSIEKVADDLKHSFHPLSHCLGQCRLMRAQSSR